MAATKRNRTRRSCNQCRKARTKCSSGMPCERCQRHGMACSYHDVHGNETTDTRPTHSSGIEQQQSASGPAAIRMSSHVDDSGNSIAGMEWLYDSDLPASPHQIRILVSRYFQHVHPLRCFAFIHKPSYMSMLETSPSSPLIYIICALGAQFYSLEHNSNYDHVLGAGGAWARKALSLVLSDIGSITVDNLMTIQLFYDYALRMANFPQAFMLSALTARMTQALQINLEYSQDVLCEDSDSSPSVTVRECRRRVMWSCYITDALCGSGVDQLTLIKDEDVKIQLPCNEMTFLSGESHITPGLKNQRWSPSPLIPGQSTHVDESKIGIAAYFIRHIEVRKRVLKYIKHLDKAKKPWLPESEFAAFNNELQQWYSTLPENLRLTSKTILLRQETNQLGALCLLHCAYHQTLCDLYRIGTPALYKLRSAFVFPPEHAAFQRQLQWSLFKAGRALAAIMADAMRHGHHNLSDSWLPTIAYDSNRCMLFYLTKIHDTSIQDGARDLILNTIPYLQSNVEVLRIMRATNVIANGLHKAANSMLRRLGVDSNSILPRPDLVLYDPYINNLEASLAARPGSPSQGAPDYVLNPLSIFRMARNDIPERHAPRNAYTGPDLDAQRLPEDFDLDMDLFFAPDLAWNWQPAQTILASREANEGLLPWADNLHMAEYDAV